MQSHWLMGLREAIQLEDLLVNKFNSNLGGVGLQLDWKSNLYIVLSGKCSRLLYACYNMFTIRLSYDPKNEAINGWIDSRSV